MGADRVLRERVHRRIALWLYFLLFMIFVIVLLGGSTRLTGSGLSMADIRVLRGVIPPVGELEWEEVFSEYRSTAEYKITYEKEGMDIEGFKGIFWLEYFHRLFARVLAGLVFFVPFLYFLIRYYFVQRVISLSLLFRLVLMFVLGALQGLVGWIMVKSGLYEHSAYIEGGVVSVSPYRLSIHLGLALLIYGYILWTALKVYPFSFKVYSSKIRSSAGKPFILSVIILFLLFITVVSGAFVAGTKAGMVSKTFPLMLGNFSGYLVPPDLFTRFWYLDIFENKLVVQFNHRFLAYFVFVFVIYLWYLLGKASFVSLYLRHSLLVMLLFQLTLGVVTLLTFIPKSGYTVFMGTAHQGGAFILFTLLLIVSYRLSVLRKV